MVIDQNMLILIAIGVVALLLIGVLWLVSSRARMDGEERRIAAENAAAQINAILQANTGLESRIKVMSENHAHAQEEIKRTMHERLDAVSKRVGDSLEQSREKTGESLEKLKERLTVIDEAQKNITDLSGQMVGLQEILSNKQARGAFGEVQLNDLVSSILPPSAYEFQATLENGKRADCLIKLPNPPGSIVVDAKFPLESYHRLHADCNDIEKRKYQSPVLFDLSSTEAIGACTFGGEVTGCATGGVHRMGECLTGGGVKPVDCTHGGDAWRKKRK